MIHYSETLGSKKTLCGVPGNVGTHSEQVALANGWGRKLGLQLCQLCYDKILEASIIGAGELKSLAKPPDIDIEDRRR
jgi:hypothetical protein